MILRGLIVGLACVGLASGCSGDKSAPGGGSRIVDHVTLKVKTGPELTAEQKVKIEEFKKSIEDADHQVIAMDKALPDPEESTEEKQKHDAKFDKSSEIVKKFYGVITNQDASGRCQIKLPTKQIKDTCTIGEVGNSHDETLTGSITGANCPMIASIEKTTKSTITRLDRGAKEMDGTQVSESKKITDMQNSEFKSQFPMEHTDAYIKNSGQFTKNIQQTKYNADSNGHASMSGPGLNVGFEFVSQFVSATDEGEQNGYSEILSNIDFNYHGLKFTFSLLETATIVGGKTATIKKYFINGRETTIEEAQKYIPNIDELNK